MKDVWDIELAIGHSGIEQYNFGFINCETTFAPTKGKRSKRHLWSLRWPVNIINSVEKTKHIVLYFPAEAAVSLETYPLYLTESNRVLKNWFLSLKLPLVFLINCIIQ